MSYFHKQTSLKELLDDRFEVHSIYTDFSKAHLGSEWNERNEEITNQLRDEKTRCEQSNPTIFKDQAERLGAYSVGLVELE